MLLSMTKATGMAIRQTRLPLLLCISAMLALPGREFSSRRMPVAKA